MQNASERSKTYHDQWYLIENLKPRLRPDVFVRKMVYGSVPWYVLGEPDNNAHFRIASAGYYFVSKLDGTKSIQEIWELLQEIDDEPLTQGEIITLLGNLHKASLLILDMPADTEKLLKRMQEKRLKKLGNALSSFLFWRIPLFSPDKFFTKFLNIGSFIFKPFGFVLWLSLALLALRELFLNWDMFLNEAAQTLAPSNLIWVYFVIILAKFFHESGHAFACKYFSAKDGLRGDVHNLGIMLLLFAPVPYIDVSSSTQLRSKFSRAAIAFAGMYSELLLAFLATLLWANTSPDTSLHLLARNSIIITSVTTILFNINPLLRFDGYFIFSDLLDLPNLYQRSQQFTLYLIKKYILGIKNATTNVKKQNEKIIYPLYAVFAFIYRVFITLGIYFILRNTLATLGIVLMFCLLFVWFILPLIKGIIYLFTGSELAGIRPKTIFRVFLILGVSSCILTFIPVSNTITIDGIVESREYRIIFAEVEGTLEEFLASDTKVEKDISLLATIANPGLLAQYEEMKLSVDITKAKYEFAQEKSDINQLGLNLLEYQSALQQLMILEYQVSKQNIISAIDGIWVAPELGRKQGKWIARGEALGSVYDPKSLRLRLLVNQFDAARLFAEKIIFADFVISDRIDIRDKENNFFSAILEGKPMQAGRKEIIHPSLAIEGGGDIITVQNQGRTETLEHFFELRLIPNEEALDYLLSGQKVIVRLQFEKMPLLFQWARRIRQYFLNYQ